MGDYLEDCPKEVRFINEYDYRQNWMTSFFVPIKLSQLKQKLRFNL